MDTAHLTGRKCEQKGTGLQCSHSQLSIP